MSGDRKATLVAILKDEVSGTAKKIQAEITGIGTSVGKVNTILAGVGLGIGEGIFNAMSDAVGTVVRAIPKLIDEGNSYLEQLHQIQLETGMTAEQTSLLVGTMKNLGVPVDDLSTLFARLGANIGRNEGNFRALGVATRDTDGNLLSSYQIVENLRAAVQAHGESLLSTAAAQELFGRSAFNLLPFLQATDDQLAVSSENVRRWGGVISQAAIDGARQFDTTLRSFWSGITDVGVQIAAAVDPYLRAFVDSFAKFVQAHLQEIINFAVAVVNTVTGFISGLFGITAALDVSASGVATSTAKAATGTDNFGKIVKGAAGGVDAFTASINRQIKAIDAHITAMTQAAEKRRAIQERARLEQGIAAAQAQLADLRGNAPFLAGLSGGEQALAVQKHAQDIIDAEKNVHDQRTALGNFEADQKDRAERELLSREKQRLQDSLAAHKAADAAIAASGLQMATGLDRNISAVLGDLGTKSQQFGKTAADSFKSGVAAARGFLDVLLGVEHTATDRGEGSFRTGGLIGALAQVGAVMVQLGGLLVGVVKFIGDSIAKVDWSLVGGINNYNPLVGLYNNFQNALHAVGHAKGGWVGLHGPELGVLGENGPEYVVSNPNLGRMGGGLTVNLYADFLSKPSDDQIREVTEKISRRLAFTLANTGATTRSAGSF